MFLFQWLGCSQNNDDLCTVHWNMCDMFNSTFLTFSVRCLRVSTFICSLRWRILYSSAHTVNNCILQVRKSSIGIAQAIMSVPVSGLQWDRNRMIFHWIWTVPVPWNTLISTTYLRVFHLSVLKSFSQPCEMVSPACCSFHLSLNGRELTTLTGERNDWERCPWTQCFDPYQSVTICERLSNKTLCPPLS